LPIANAPAPTDTTQSTQPTALYSQESERMLVGAAFYPDRSELYMKLMGLLAPKDFFVEQHAAIWKIIQDQREGGREADVTAVLDYANTNRISIGGAEYLVGLFNDPMVRSCTDESALSAAKRVKEFAASRDLQQVLIAGHAMISAGQPADQVMNVVDDDIANMRRARDSAQQGPRQQRVFVEAYLERLNNAMETGESVTRTMSTGFPELDDVLGGGLADGMTVLAARPSMGKTAFATAIEQNCSNRGVPTILFSGEMSGLSITQRNLSRHARIPFQNLRQANLSTHEWDSLILSAQVLSDTHSYIDDTPGLSLGEIRARARAFHAKFAPLTKDGRILVLVDYLQIVAANPDSPKDPMRLASEISRGLTSLGKELACPVLVLSQLNRTLESRANKRPMMSDLRESGQIEQDAEAILFLYRDEVYNPDSADVGITEVIAAKTRDSRPGIVKFISALEMMLYTPVGGANYAD
jgi:replicative DNA helicase